MNSRRKAEDDGVIHSFGQHLRHRSPPLSVASIAAYQGDVLLFAEYLRKKGLALLPPRQAHEELYIKSVELCRKPRTVQRKAAALREFREFARSMPRLENGEKQILEAAEGHYDPLQTDVTDKGRSLQALALALALAFVSLQSNPSTKRAYSSDLEKLTGALEGRELEGISGEEVESVVEGLRGILKPTSLRRLNATVRTFFNWLKKNGHGVQARIRYVISGPKSEAGRLSSAAVKKTAKRIRRVGLTARDETVIRLLLLGLTPAEIVSLKVEDLDLQRRLITVTSRRLRLRSLKVAGALSSALSNCLRETSVLSGEIFRNARGTVLTTRSVGRVASDFAKRAGLAKNVNPSAIRRAAAEAAIRAGEDAIDVKHSLGLAGIEVLRKYL